MTDTTASRKAWTGVSPTGGARGEYNGSGDLRWFFTKHAQERLYERFPKRFSEEAQKAWRRGERRPLLQETFGLFREAEERRQFLNDTRFMTSIHEKHGWDQRYSFRVNGNIVFVCVENHSTLQLVIITVIDLSEGRSYNHRNMGGRTKFTGRTRSAS